MLCRTRLLLFSGLFCLILFPAAKQARAIALPTPCLCTTFQGCTSQDCDNAEEVIKELNEEGTDTYLVDNDHSSTQDHGASFNHQFNDFEEWLMRFSKEQIVPAMQRMTTQLSSAAMSQVFAIGAFFDAKLQLSTQRTFQALKIEAHRDYQPSEDFCWFGTNVRSMAASESHARYQSATLNAQQMGRHLGNRDNGSAASPGADKRARWERFTQTYCDTQDNYWNGATNSGLTAACGNIGGGDSARVNIDIDYTRLIDNKRTLDLGASGAPDREDVFALGNNLYGHDVLKRDMKAEDYQGLYLALRSVAARRNVAQNSFNAIVELKTASDPASEAPQTHEFLGAILKEMGVHNDEIISYIGERPSYYAQLEILAKTIYQNPKFYANLYDKPANVARKSVALKAIELMLDRAIYDSQLRREMATSVLLSTKLQSKIDNINKKTLGGR